MGGEWTGIYTGGSRGNKGLQGREGSRIQMTFEPQLLT